MSIEDFVKEYADSDITRLHMPGHKGVPIVGGEPYDITEIKGADSLYEADPAENGIIAESEQRTADAFGSLRTFYSTEGSSLSIKAALCAVRLLKGRPVTIAAARNCHAAFINGCALLGIDPVWLIPDSPRSNLCECRVSAESIADTLAAHRVDAVYVTSPDYIGNLADIRAIADVCHKHGALVIVDNAHGAYLKALTPSLHPLDLGADIVCDSAHKTLPVYTGGAYLHISRSAPHKLTELCKPAMLMFGSTSPSYLLLNSLDRCSHMLHDELSEMIRSCCRKTAKLKQSLLYKGIRDLAAEPMKITIAAADTPYSGTELADLMRAHKIEPEYADPYVTVMMFSPYNNDRDFSRVQAFAESLEKSVLSHDKLYADNTELFSHLPEKVMPLREAMLSTAEEIPPETAENRICARAALSCQPSVAAVMPGERISAETVKILKRYSISRIYVL